MTEQMVPLSFQHQIKWIINEYARDNSIFNIPAQNFYLPETRPVYATRLFDSDLLTPVGPAAGPHTQMTQNIVTAWLTGSRFIELKTVQIMDELEIARPCIDMTDEGYNVEWSQELKLRQSGTEYIHAWVLIHILRRILKLEWLPLGTIFNMSVGYDYAGVTGKPMRAFIERMLDASDDIERIRQFLRVEYPAFADIDIPSQISNNVTVSTMHGCPPEEIEKLAAFLLREYNLHTVVKLNPTLLGRDKVLDILNRRLGYDYIRIPETVFNADLRWDAAVDLIRSLMQTAQSRHLHFGVKLSNTLAMRNELKRLPGDEVYMSGRALCPVTIQLFKQLRETFDASLPVSYSAGADAMNIHRIIAAGALPVTVASDMLKPGGYARTGQYLEVIEKAMMDDGSKSLREFQENSQNALAELSQDVLLNSWYHKDRHRYGVPKLDTPLPLFDCIEAPCTATCPAQQNVPSYIRRIAGGDTDSALRSILKQNPLPGMTGYVCPHTCQFKCTRNAYDAPLQIRHLKRFARDNVTESSSQETIYGPSVAVVGGGPSGLAAAAFLCESGVKVTLYEASGRAGGVPALAPDFRIPSAIVASDVQRIRNLGVEIHCNHPVHNPADLLEKGFDAVYYAPGFQEDMMLDIPGASGPGVVGVMEFLAGAGTSTDIQAARHVVVIGGGNTAMDAARTARRLTGHPSTVVYRRTRHEMPAWAEEIDDCIQEHNKIIELRSPVAVVRDGDRVVALRCVRNRLGSPGEDGRRRPEPVPGSEHDIPADLVIVAIGQVPAYTASELPGLDLGAHGEIRVRTDSGETTVKHVYSGGDAVRGPSYIIQAVADGHRAANAIAKDLGVDLTTQLTGNPNTEPDWDSIYHARTHLMHAEQPGAVPVTDRGNFDVVLKGYDEKTAQKEAKRCMQCDKICDRCVDVCPNRANIPVRILPRSTAVKRLRVTEGRISSDGFDFLDIRQDRQIIHVDELCNECGNCAVFCTHSGEPFRDKPVFFLDPARFESEQCNAWHVNRYEMIRRHDGVMYNLSFDKGLYTIDTNNIHLVITPDFQVTEATVTGASQGDVSLIPVAEMIVLWEALKNHPVTLAR